MAGWGLRLGDDIAAGLQAGIGHIAVDAGGANVGNVSAASGGNAVPSTRQRLASHAVRLQDVQHVLGTVVEGGAHIVVLVVDFHGPGILIPDVRLWDRFLSDFVGASGQVLDNNQAVPVRCPLECGGGQGGQGLNGEDSALDGLVGHHIPFDDAQAGQRLILEGLGHNDRVFGVHIECDGRLVGVVAIGLLGLPQFVVAVGNLFEDDRAGLVGCEFLAVLILVIQFGAFQNKGSALQGPARHGVCFDDLDRTEADVLESKLALILAIPHLLGLGVVPSPLEVFVVAFGGLNLSYSNCPTVVGDVFVLKEPLILVVSDADFTVFVGHHLLGESRTFNDDAECSILQPSPGLRVLLDDNDVGVCCISENEREQLLALLEFSDLGLRSINEVAFWRGRFSDADGPALPVLGQELAVLLIGDMNFAVITSNELVNLLRINDEFKNSTS